MHEHKKDNEIVHGYGVAKFQTCQLATRPSRTWQHLLCWAVSSMNHFIIELDPDPRHFRTPPPRVEFEQFHKMHRVPQLG